MKFPSDLRTCPRVLIGIAVLGAAAIVAAGCAGPSATPTERIAQESRGEPYPNMPTIAPIGVRIPKYMDVPESANGPAIDPAKGYRTQDLGHGLYMVTDNAYQSMFMVYETGVVVVDA